MLARRLNSPLCSSIGRLFDAVASLAGLRQQMRFEGQAAMELEFALEGIETDEAYDLPLVTRHSPLVLDWSPMIEAILTDCRERRLRSAKSRPSFTTRWRRRSFGWRRRWSARASP